MSFVVVNVQSPEFRSYIHSQRDCRIGGSVEIGAKVGSLTLDFSTIHGASNCTLKFRRQSGNGKVIIVCDTSVETAILSKTYQSVVIDINKSKKIEIRRPPNSIGVVEFIGAELGSLEEEVLVPAKNWKVVLGRCKHKAIRSVGEKLFASEGAFIETNNLINIETNPPNAYVIQDNVVKFAGTCEIVELNIGGDVASTKPVIEYKHFEAPLPVFVPPPPAEETIKIAPAVQTTAANIGIASKQIGIESFNEDLIIFDSNKINLSPYAVKTARSNGHGAILPYKGFLIIPLSILQPDTDYIVVLEASVIKGNGKIQVNLEPAAQSPNLIIASANKRYFNINVKTPKLIDNGVKLIISRTEGGTGEVFISRVIFMDHKLVTVKKHAEAYTKLLETKNDYVQTSITASTDLPTIENIEYISKTFARINIENYDIGKFNLVGTIRPTTASTSKWMTKILPLFSGINIYSYNYGNKYLGDVSLVMGSIGSLRASQRIWLEEFQGSVPSKEDLEILTKAEHIFSPSLQNIQYLRKLLTNKITLIPKVWPYIPPVQTQLSNYVITFHRSILTTKMAIDACASAGMHLVVVGARGICPSGVTFVDSDVSYAIVLGLLRDAKCIVDIAQSNHYMSGILDLAFILGVPIVTSNYWLSISKPMVHLLVPNVFVDNRFLPDSNSLVSAITAAAGQTLTKPIESALISYNQNVYANTKIMLSE